MRSELPKNPQTGVTYFINGVGYVFINGYWWKK